MKQEDLNFVLNVLQEKDFKVSADLDWYAILGFLELNKISGYFFNRAKELGIQLPQSLTRKLSQILKIQVARNEIMRTYIDDLGKALKQKKIGYAFLKGSVLSNANMNLSELAFTCMALTFDQKQKYEGQRKSLFYSLGERISNDIDILIEQKDITKVSDILKSMGFIQGYYNFKEEKVIELSRQEILSRRMNRGETAPFILKIDNEILPFIEVDINFSLDYLPNGSEGMLAKILSDTVDYAGTIQGGIKSVSGGNFFLHLIMHQYKESILYSMVERNKDLELYKLLDIYLFIERGYVDLLGIHNNIKKYGLEKEVYYVLKTVSDLFSEIAVNDFLDMIKPQDISYIDEVIDPQSKKRYVWKTKVSDRITEFNKLPFLKEIGND